MQIVHKKDYSIKWALPILFSFQIEYPTTHHYYFERKLPLRVTCINNLGTLTFVWRSMDEQVPESKGMWCGGWAGWMPYTCTKEERWTKIYGESQPFFVLFHCETICHLPTICLMMYSIWPTRLKLFYNKETISMVKSVRYLYRKDFTSLLCGICFIV